MSVRALLLMLVVASLLAGGTQEAFAHQHCSSRLVIADATHASSMAWNFTGTTITILGQFIVDEDVLFQNCQVFMEAGAGIVVLPGRTLDIMSSSVTSCRQIMWKGITARGGSTVRMRGSFVDDAENAVTALDGSTLWLRDNQFHNNRVTLHVPESEGVPWNNVAAHIRGNTFYSQGPMPQPYAGQATPVGAVGFAAIDVNYMVLDLTDGNNLIHHMSNGIVARNSDVRVADCRMLAIQPDAAYAYAGNGAGIYAFGGKGWHTLEQEGYGMDQMPSFEDCRWGINTEYMNLQSTANRMLNMGTAYRVDRSGNRTVDILQNRVFCKYHGMDLRFNEGAMHVLVQGNEVTFGTQPCLPYTVCPARRGIYVTEGSLPNQSSIIRNNTVRFVGTASSRYGIHLVSADDWLVAENTLQMADNTVNETGVWLQGCRRSNVSCNTVLGGSANYPLKSQAAIRNTMGSDAMISCNDVDGTTNGIIFNGVAPDTEVRGNKIRNHKWGLHLDGSAVIGPQELKGNLWYNAAGAGGLGAWYEDSLNAVNNAFLVNPTTISGGNAFPPSVWPTSGWFDVSSGTNYDCANDGGEDYCNQFNARGKERLTYLDVRVATDSLENDPYSDETKWMLKSRLYKKLDETPDLLDSLQVMENLYDELQGVTIADFKQIDDEQSHLFDLDSIVVSQLQENRTEIEGLISLLKYGLEQLGDSTLTQTQRQAILSDINSYRESIRELTELNAAAIQVASVSKSMTADGVKSANAGIATSELIEANQKVVNGVYLATMGKDVDAFSNEQAFELLEIAGQCPMLGGNAVFRARSLYRMIDDDQVFVDSLLCAPHGIEVKRLLEQHVNTVSVVPNPATNEAALVLTNSLDEPGVFILFDAIGAEVFRHVVPVGIPRMSFSTGSLAEALYQYQVRGPSGIIGVGKLTIVR
jgi:hypothetical protein